VNVPSRQIGESATSVVLVFDPHRPPGSRRLRRMNAVARLQARLRVGAEYILGGQERLTLPQALLQVEQRPALSSKSGSQGKIQLQCCQGRSTSSLNHRWTVEPERISQAACDCFAGELPKTETRERKILPVR
jgi:hypothetical protein